MSYPSSAVAASACPREQRARYVSATRARIAEKRGKVKQKSAAGRWTTATARHLPCSARQGDGEHWTVARSVDRDGRR